MLISQALSPPTPAACAHTDHSGDSDQRDRTWGQDDRGIEPDPGAPDGESTDTRTWGQDDRGIAPDLDDERQ